MNQIFFIVNIVKQKPPDSNIKLYTANNILPSTIQDYIKVE